MCPAAWQLALLLQALPRTWVWLWHNAQRHCRPLWTLVRCPWVPWQLLRNACDGRSGAALPSDPAMALWPGCAPCWCSDGVVKQARVRVLSFELI